MVEIANLSLIYFFAPLLPAACLKFRLVLKWEKEPMGIMGGWRLVGTKGGGGIDLDKLNNGRKETEKKEEKKKNVPGVNSRQFGTSVDQD